MGIHSHERKFQSVVVMVFTIMLGSLLLIFIYKFKGDRNFKASVELNETAEDITAVQTRKVVLQKELPICIGNLLDQRKFHYEKGTNAFVCGSQLMTKTGPCWLRQYTVEHAVTCFDVLASVQQDRLLQEAVDPINRRRKELHFVFMGDSRIRQQFLSFIRLIPDYDRLSLPNPIPFRHHGDIEITSNIIRVRVSFKWRPLVNDNVTQTIRKWTSTDPSKRPYWIFLGMTAWHMLREHGANYRLYQEKLSELGPLLSQLANVSQVIWLHQYPSVDFYGAITASNTAIISEKIHGYNKMTRQMLESLHSRIRIWDSSNPLVEEYTRDCTIFKRQHEKSRIGDPSMPVEYALGYFNCEDYIHTGYSALSEATQLLYNDICNGPMDIRTRRYNNMLE